MFRTGDFGRIVRGQLYYEGRSDSQIKVRGHRIDLNEVNLVVSRLDGVSACVVLCYKAGEPEQVRKITRIKKKYRSRSIFLFINCLKL